MRKFFGKAGVVLRLLKEGVIIAFNELRANKFRTFLSLLSVSIGIFTLVAVFTVIDGLKHSVQNSLDSIGGDTMVTASNWPMGPEDEEGNLDFSGETELRWWDYVRRPPMKYDDYKYLKERLKQVKRIGFFDQFTVAAKHGRKSIPSVSVIYCTEDVLPIFNLEVAEGRGFTSNEHRTGAHVAVIGAGVAKALFNGETPVNRRIKLGGEEVVVIGALPQGNENAAVAPDTEDAVFIPYLFGQRFVNSNHSQGQIMIIADNENNVQSVVTETITLLRQHRRLKPSEKNNFSVSSLASLQEMVNSIINTVNKIGWLIAAFSLLIGGFGIANVMFVSVKERTRIIGIQKALGAKGSFIITQFMTEAVALSIAGALVGVIPIWLLTLAINIPQFPLALSLGNVLAGIAIASVIGVLSGIMPALSAARLNPVDAINSK